MTEPTRTPYCTKIRYGVTGAPEIPIDVSTAPDVTLSPTLVEIRYLAPRGSQPAFIDATVTGYWMRDGERWQPEKELLHHFKNGPEGWPAWLAEEARLHDPDAAAVPPPADRAALRQRIAEALALRKNGPASDGRGWFRDEEERQGFLTDADAVLPVLPAPVDRASVLREAADVAEDVAIKRHNQHEIEREQGALDVMTVLRRLAADATPQHAAWDVADARPGTTDYTLTRAVEHAPGKAILCPDCRAKGRAICMADVAPQPVGYSGKGRVFCIACPHPDGEDVPLTADEVDHWELCPSCGRHVIDVASADEGADRRG